MPPRAAAGLPALEVSGQPHQSWGRGDETSGSGWWGGRPVKSCIVGPQVVDGRDESQPMRGTLSASEDPGCMAMGAPAPCYPLLRDGGERFRHHERVYAGPHARCAAPGGGPPTAASERDAARLHWPQTSQGHAMHASSRSVAAMRGVPHCTRQHGRLAASQPVHKPLFTAPHVQPTPAAAAALTPRRTAARCLRCGTATGWPASAAPQTSARRSSAAWSPRCCATARLRPQRCACWGQRCRTCALRGGQAADRRRGRVAN